jgi:hypothetical protein
MQQHPYKQIRFIKPPQPTDIAQVLHSANPLSDHGLIYLLISDPMWSARRSPLTAHRIANNAVA